MAVTGGENDGGRRVRVCHVQLLPLLTGVQRVSLDELARLDPARYDRHLVCKEPGPLTEAAAAVGVRCHVVPTLVRSARPRSDVRAYLDLRRVMRAGRFDVVHTQSSKSGVLGRLAAAAERVSAVVHTVQGFGFVAARDPLTRRLFLEAERAAGRRSDAVIVLHDEDRRIAVGQVGIPPDRVRVLPNGVDVHRFGPLPPARRAAVRAAAYGVADDRPVVICVGRLWPQKNPRAFVATAGRLSSRFPDARFVMVGDGELRAAVQADVAAAGLADRVRLLGWRDDVPDLLAAADLFLLPSLWEGLPLVLLESLACGTPAVASDIPGNRAAVAAGVDGELAPPEPDRLAAAVARLLADPARRRAFGEAGRAKVTRDFDVDDRVRRIEALYAELLGRTPAP